MTTKTIVVLANSFKKGGRCLAGKEVHMAGDQIEGFGAWIRPISCGQVEVAGESEGGQVTVIEMQRALSRATKPSILEILEIPFFLRNAARNSCHRKPHASLQRHRSTAAIPLQDGCCYH